MFLGSELGGFWKGLPPRPPPHCKSDLSSSGQQSKSIENNAVLNLSGGNEALAKLKFEIESLKHTFQEAEQNWNEVGSDEGIRREPFEKIFL